jgi:hypothetical protein
MARLHFRPPSPGGATRALVAPGAAVLVVSRAPGRATLACTRDGELCLVDVAPASRTISTGDSRVRRVSVDEGELTDEAAAERVGALLFGDV